MWFHCLGTNGGHAVPAQAKLLVSALLQKLSADTDEAKKLKSTAKKEGESTASIKKALNELSSGVCKPNKSNCGALMVVVSNFELVNNHLIFFL